MRGELEGAVVRNVVWPPAPDALRPGSGIGHGTPVWEVGARRSSPRASFSRNGYPGDCNEGRVGGGRSQECGLAPGAGRTTPWVGHWAWNAGLGSWGNAQFAQGVIPGEPLRGGLGQGNGEERSPASGYAVGRRIDGNCAATMRVRSGVAVRPEHVKFADRLLVVGSYAAVMGKQPELVVRSNRRV